MHIRIIKIRNKVDVVFASIGQFNLNNCYIIYWPHNSFQILAPPYNRKVSMTSKNAKWAKRILSDDEEETAVYGVSDSIKSVIDEPSYFYIGSVAFAGQCNPKFHTNNRDEELQLQKTSHLHRLKLRSRAYQYIQASIPFSMFIKAFNQKTNIGKFKFYSKVPRLPPSKNQRKLQQQKQQLEKMEQDLLKQRLNQNTKRKKKQIQRKMDQIAQRKNTAKKISKKFITVRCQVYMSKLIFNEVSPQYTLALKRLDSMQSLLNTLKSKSQQYKDLRNQMDEFIRSYLFQQKIARTLLLYFMEKTHIKVINRSFVKPPPKLNFLMRQYRRETIGLITKNKRNQRALQRKIRKWKNAFTTYTLVYPCVGPRNQMAYSNKYYKALPKDCLYWKNLEKDQLAKKIIFDQNLVFQSTNGIIQRTRQVQIFQAKNRKQFMDEIGASGFGQDEMSQSDSQQEQQLKEASQKQMDVDAFKLMKKNQALMDRFQTQNKYFKQHSTPPSMISQLKPYQGQALQWMKYRQGKITVDQLFQKNYKGDVEGFEFQRKLSPFWQEIEMIGGQKFYVNYLTGQFTQKFNDWKSIKGGILADEMGLGKTVMTLSLLADENWQGLNLIVVPVAVLLQWKQQIAKHCGQHIRVYEFHSDSRSRRKKDLSQFNVVLITYATLGHEYKYYASNGNTSKQGQKSLFQYNFQRVVLDEAHNIRGTTTLQFNAVVNLKSKYSWCLTGTLIQNSEQDLFAIFKFLKVQVFSEEPWWNQYIKNAGCTQAKMNVIQTVLRPIVLRRTKASTSNEGQSIIQLTKKHEYVIRPEFTKLEAKIYQQLQTGARKYFKSNIQAGKSYTHVFQIIGKLRQFCCHPALVLGEDLQDMGQKDIQKILDKFLGKTAGKQFKQSAVNAMLKGDQNCVICLTEPDDQNAVLTQCGHFYCQTCLNRTMNLNPHCPICRALLTPRDYIKKSDLVPSQEMKDLNESTKLTAVFNTLKQIEQRGEKCVVFTQWVKIISLMEQKLLERGVQFAVVMGNMNPEKRQRAIKRFKQKNSCKFLIVSIRAGATGLNLAFANNVIICDPWWNPSQQDQAVGRVHRLGQTKEVNVYRFIMKNSIEQRILKMHASKRQLANQVMMQKGSLQNAKNLSTEQLIRLLEQD